MEDSVPLDFPWERGKVACELGALEKGPPGGGPVCVCCGCYYSRRKTVGVCESAFIESVVLWLECSQFV